MRTGKSLPVFSAALLVTLLFSSHAAASHSRDRRLGCAGRDSRGHGGSHATLVGRLQHRQALAPGQTHDLVRLRGIHREGLFNEHMLPASRAAIAFSACSEWGVAT